jgi:hypothetical protein
MRQQQSSTVSCREPRRDVGAVCLTGQCAGHYALLEVVEEPAVCERRTHLGFGEPARPSGAGRGIADREQV